MLRSSASWREACGAKPKPRGRIPKALLDPNVFFYDKDDKTRAKTLNKADPHKAARYAKIIKPLKENEEVLRILPD